jgi:hypothetical protein
LVDDHQADRGGQPYGFGQAGFGQARRGRSPGEIFLRALEGQDDGGAGWRAGGVSILLLQLLSPWRGPG